MSYDNWRKRLTVSKLPTVAARRAELTRLGLNNMEPTHQDEGYYRIPITVKDASGNGKNIVTGYTPVALFLNEISLVGVRGDDDMTTNQVVDSWTWFCSYPISYELYQAVAERGEPWPDLQKPIAGGMVSRAALELIPGTSEVVVREITRTDNLPPTVDPVVEHSETIDNAISSAIMTYNTITSNEMAAQAEGAKNRIAELRLQADKARAAAVEPHLREQQRVNGLWMPMVNVAKAAETALKTAILTWREKERRRIASEQAAAAQKQREAEEAAERAADRAIATGTPPAEQEAPLVEPEPVAPTPAPVKPTYGTRTTKATESWHFDEVTDFDALYAAVKDTAEIKAAMTVLAKALVKAGRDVPGVKRHWGVI